MPQWISDIISVWPALGALAVICFVLGFIWKQVWPVIQKASIAFDDFNGRPARPGVPAQPGFMERFATSEAWQDKYGPVIDSMQHELHPNSGSSMADAVNRTEKQLGDHLLSCPAISGQTTVTVNTGATP